MQLDALHIALIGGFVTTGSTFIGVWAGRKSVNLCDKCGITDIKIDISCLCALVRLLAEKAGISVESQLELERDVKQTERLKN